MKKFLLLSAVLAVQPIATHAVEYVDWVDWDQIQHWAGDPDGQNKCALVIDFQDIEGMESLVWGYRWNGKKTGEDLIRAVASQSSILTAMILPFLIFNPIMYTISETTVSGLVFMKKSKMQVFVAAGACLTNLVGNYIFVPILGGKGAAISTGLSYIVFFALRTIFSNRYFYVDFSLKRFSILTVLAILYAFYNTFVKFNYLCVVFYVAIMTIMFALYKDTIIWGIKYLIDIFTNKILRR